MKRVIVSLVDGVIDEQFVPEGVELTVFDSDGDTGQGLDAITAEMTYTHESKGQMTWTSIAQLAVYARVYKKGMAVNEDKYVLAADGDRPEVELSDVHDKAIAQIEAEIERVKAKMEGA